MATIESSPLPPPGLRGQLAKITEADRAKIMAQANEVIDFYLNGPGSFTPDGPRKPPVDDPRFDSTVRDLKNFRASVVTAKQYAEDPSHILDSVADLIKKTVGQIEQVVRDQAITGPDVKDGISKPPPDTVDPLNNARVPVPLPTPDVTQDPSNGSHGGVRPITLQTPNPPQTTGLDLSPSPGVAPTLAQARSPSALTFTSPDVNAPASLFSRLMSAGPASLLTSDGAASPLQPDLATQPVDRPERYLASFTYPSQGSPFKAQPAPALASPDGTLSLTDAYLEYLRRLNAA
jgi:hypothetical protein